MVAKIKMTQEQKTAFAARIKDRLSAAGCGNSFREISRVVDEEFEEFVIVEETKLRLDDFLDEEGKLPFGC